MEVLKGIGYAVAAVAVLTLLVLIGGSVIVLGLAVGITAFVLWQVLLIAMAIRSWWESAPTKEPGEL